MKQLIYLLIAITAFTSCIDESFISENAKDRFAVYLLNDSKLVATEAAKRDLSTLQLASEPLFTAANMKYYKWKEHTFSVDTVCAKKIRDAAKANPSVFGIPFVVTVDRERIYLGALWLAHSSFMPSFPNVLVYFASSPLQQTFYIDLSVISSVDKRNDERIYNALKSVGILVE